MFNWVCSSCGAVISAPTMKLRAALITKHFESDCFKEGDDGT